MKNNQKSVYRVDDNLAGNTLAKVVRALSPGLSWNQARELCYRGKVRLNGELETNSARRVASGDRIAINPTARRIRPNVLDPDALLYFDSQIVVVNKRAGLISVPFEKTQRDTLADQARILIKQKTGSRGAELGVVQRLDVGTTGVLVFARTLAAKRHLKQQFREHTIERRYLAIAHGRVKAATIETLLVQDRGDGLRGSFGAFRPSTRTVPKGARRAVTHVRPVRALRGATLVECRLETGRQHQIRIHLSERGHPLVGEKVYVRDFKGRYVAAGRPMLHAEVLGFIHPSTLEPMRFVASPPEDFAQLLVDLTLST